MSRIMQRRIKRPTFNQGVVVALVLSLFGSALFSVFTPIFTNHSMLRVIIALVALGYILYLLNASQSRTGKVTCLSLWVLVAVSTWYLSPSILLYALIHIGMIWLIRSLFHYQSTLTSLIDFGLNTLSLIVALWAIEQTNSLFISLWTFFLMQALCMAIPSKCHDALCKIPMDIALIDKQEHDGNDRFNRAFHSAQSALRRLS